MAQTMETIKEILKEEEVEENSDSDEESDDDQSDSSVSSTSCSTPSGSSTSGQLNERDPNKEVLAIAPEETRALRKWRIIVIVLIVLLGAIVTAKTFIYLESEEDQDHEVNFAKDATRIRGAVQDKFRDMNIAFNQLSRTVTATATSLHQSFPYVNIPQWETYGQDARTLSGAESSTWVPFITQEQRSNWNQFSSAFQDWLVDSRDAFFRFNPDSGLTEESFSYNTPIKPDLWVELNNGTWFFEYEDAQEPYGPLWQMSPPPLNSSVINYNLMNETYVQNLVAAMNVTRDGLLSAVNANLGPLECSTICADGHGQMRYPFIEEVFGASMAVHPQSLHVQPVYWWLSDEANAPIAGFIASVIAWDSFLTAIAPQNMVEIYGVLQNSCGQTFTYLFNEDYVEFLGPRDLHDTFFDFTKVEIPLSVSDASLAVAQQVEGHCIYTLTLYSSDAYKESVKGDAVNGLTIGVAIVFLTILFAFCTFDNYVKTRNARVLDSATRANKILSTLFPKKVRERMFEEVEAHEMMPLQDLHQAPKAHLKNLLTNGDLMGHHNDDESDEDMYKSKPIADLFPDTTIMFADIAGFTAWSSVREPSQVFVLLETVYRAFDGIAKKRRVFKVETVGDCYVAVTGLPDPRKDHAVVMARFARDCMFKMRRLVKQLECTLGPDTGDLAIRIGLHSGPVTAGVLRGDRSRFQLFGDTMNTAARMEHTGIKNKIQFTQDTADLLICAGKSNWIVPREDMVSPKGKGDMCTYWLKLKGDKSDGSISGKGGTSSGDSISLTSLGTSDEDCSEAKTSRLIDWNVEVMAKLLKQIVAHREVCPEANTAPPNEDKYVLESGKTIDEVQEIINLPTFDERNLTGQRHPDKIQLSKEVMEQLRAYVTNIAATYRNNPFHNFEHASHVLMSVNKLLSRIVAPEITVENANAATLHDHTYGITSDPLTQFACVFSALIHDADHPGVPNAQLVKEKTVVASYYENKSVAEQNSIDLAWHLLMDDDYQDLRKAIYSTDSELSRFRHLVVNSVMATDIVDKELKVLRNNRWDRAFSEGAAEDNHVATNRKATIVIEHLIQASDISHTMQHWHVYRKWNERFFCECYQAYKDGRAETDPSENWFQGEIGFFDFYIIPLAKKLKNCGVFGVSSDEYLNYAMLNRKEWEARGREVVSELIELVKAKEDPMEADIGQIENIEELTKP